MPELEPIYLDYSTLTAFQTCKESARLSFREHLQPRTQHPALDFGSGFHKAAEVLSLTSDIEKAKTAFLDYCREERVALPLSIEADERRSVERGLNILEAYAERWKDEPYELVDRAYTEVKFRILFGEHKGHPVYIVGTIDKVMRSKTSGKIWNWEIKTTSMGLTNFQSHAKPNHQVGMYDWALFTQFKMDIAGTIWDMIFISSRAPNAKGGKWSAKGIDFEKDFARIETRRSDTDRAAFVEDLTMMVEEYLWWCDSGRPRWTRNAPKACYMYGKCKFIPICNSNLNPDLIRSEYIVKPWEPWK